MKYPLHAYIPGRNTESAITRVTEHCRAIRTKHQGQLANVHTRRARVKQQHVIGGIQLAIDLSTAFDMVPRDKLLQALIRAGSSDILANAVLDLHQVCRYSIQHRGRVRHICMRRGVRQGCTLAPLLWAVYSAYITHHIAEELTMSWVSEHLTLHADDTHASWTVESLESLKLALKPIPYLPGLRNASQPVEVRSNYWNQGSFLYSFHGIPHTRPVRQQTSCTRPSA